MGLGLLLVLAAACNRSDAPQPAADEPADVSSPNDGQFPASAESGVADPANDAKAVPAGEPAAEPSDTSAPPPADPASGPGIDVAADAPAQEPPAAAEPPPPTPASLLKEVRSGKTSDQRAKAALAEAEAAGAKPQDLAKAAIARGQALYGAPDRAAVFFQWAAEKDPKNAAATFALAKQAAVIGDIPATKQYLQQTHERGGSDLLQQIDFDPTWEIVKDDPDVRKLLQ